MAKIKQILILFNLLLYLLNYAQIKVGAEKVTDYINLIQNKNIAIVANQTSMINKTHLVDSLFSLKINITKIFSPEHGFRG